MFCTKCGYEILGNVMFCPKCGQEISQLDSNTMEEAMARTYTLSIKRAEQWYLVNPPVKIVLDGETEYKIDSGEILNIPVSSGSHNIVFSSSIRKKIVDINVVGNVNLNLKWNRITGNLEVDILGMISKEVGSNLNDIDNNADFNNKNDNKVNSNNGVGGKIIGVIVMLPLIFAIPGYNLYRTVFSEERVCKAAESAEKTSIYKDTGFVASTNSQVIYSSGEHSIVVVYDVVDNIQWGSRAYKVQRSTGYIYDQTRDLEYNEDYNSRLDEIKVLFGMD